MVLCSLLLLAACSGRNGQATTPVTSTASSPPASPSRMVITAAASRSTRSASATADVAATVIARTTPQVLATYDSPDLRWEARVRIHQCVPVEDYGDLAYEALDFQGDSDTFVADRQLINCGGLGAAGLAGLFWSPDSRYFYYTTAREGVPEGCDQYWSRPFSRVDLSDRSVQYIGIGELAPGGQVIAAWQDASLLVLPIEAEAGTLLDLPYQEQQLGALAWSPTSAALAFVQDQSFCPASGSSVFLLSLDRLEPLLLFSPEDGLVLDVRWAGSERLLLLGQGDLRWVYDLARGAFITTEP
jgi:hypothetical protein